MSDKHLTLEDIFDAANMLLHNRRLKGFSPSPVIRMSTTDLEILARKAREVYPVSPSICQDEELPCSIYGISIEIDDSLEEPEFTYRERGLGR